eukprot:TRINITY_DN17469_c0_g2_i1.p1 TRINITY_DN17469_c0_g2~~TRINITY_DN17469_c0_g2_i1.p1  ORF type:complete len:3828 (-),score=1166.38 TRINITY_DN17469_c0_g2_i1:164-11647(-)
MDELTNKIEKVLGSAATQAATGSNLLCGQGQKAVIVTLKDGTKYQRDLTPDELLGIGDDEHLLADQLRTETGEEITSVEIPKGVSQKEQVNWCDSLSHAFVKAWSSKVSHVDFLEKVCICGEGLVGRGQHAIALSEVYTRQSDRYQELQAQLKKMPASGDKPRSVSMAARFLLGRCVSLYKVTIQRDEAACRPDTVETLRDVLRDIVEAVHLVNHQAAALREELHWLLYNANLLALRVCRWLRLHGHGGVGHSTLWWLTQGMAKCLPLMAVHMLPYRMRFYQELALAAESVQQLGEALKVCDEALETVAYAQKLETMLPPVPEESTQIFENALTRFRLLKIKYEFWLGKVADAKTAYTQAEAVGGEAKAAACLLEALQITHGLKKQFGGVVVTAEEAAEAAANAAAAAAEAAKGKGKGKGAAEQPPEAGDAEPEVTKFTHAIVQQKQCELIEQLVAVVRPHLDKVDEATKFLEDFTKERLAYEAEQERKAFSDDPPPTKPATEEEGVETEEQPGKEELKAPQEPDAEQRAALGFSSSSPNHTIEEVFPVSAHLFLVRESLRHEMMSAGSKLEGVFKELEKYLALRVRYRHFLSPPLVDIDVVQTPARSKDKVELPDKYDCLTDDLNALSLRNRQIESEEAERGPGGQADPTVQPPKACHIYIIGQRYNVWDSWTSEHTVPIQRIGNLRMVFANRQKGGQHDSALDFTTPLPLGLQDGEQLRPWLDPYDPAAAGDSSGFDHTSSTSQFSKATLQRLAEAGHVVHRKLPLPVEPHQGNAPTGTAAKKIAEGPTPYLLFSVFNERSIFVRDKGSGISDGTLKLPEQSTLVAGAEAGDAPAAEEAEKEADSETLLPPWCPLLDDALAACMPVSDIFCFLTKHMHASVPHSRFNAMIRADLRQTPQDLVGRPFQTYVFCCAAADAPSVVCITRHLRLFKSLHKLYNAPATVEAPISEPPADGEEAPEAPKIEEYVRTPLTQALVDLVEGVSRLVADHGGQLFLLEAADAIEDVCAHVFLKIVWPRLREIQETWLRDEQGERVLSTAKRDELADWADVLRQVLPVLLRVLGHVKAVDALTLGSAAFALSKLFIQDSDGKRARAELGRAISYLEDEIARSWIQGPQPRLDQPVAAAVAFDAAALRPSNYALFDEEAFEQASSGMTHRSPVVLSRLRRLEQDRICLLTQLYERWLDNSLRTHLKNPLAPVRRHYKPGERRPEDDHLGPEPGDTKLTLSHQESTVLARLGENPYLRCLFFVTVARRRSDTAQAALLKACKEVEAACLQEQELWAFLAEELERQQKILNTGNGKAFGAGFGQKGVKAQNQRPPAHPPLLQFRAPGYVRLRAPPLLDLNPPPRLAAARELEPEPQPYMKDSHCQQTGFLSPGASLIVSATYAKPAGVGTAVTDQHRDLPGTWFRHGGYEFLEIGGLKPNARYSFASIYYQGLEAMRPAVSAASATSPPIGTYYPLPLSLLRIEVCKGAIKAGDMGKMAWKRCWPTLLDSFCEQTSEGEQFDSCGARTLKLRLDVVDRVPPAILAAFADVVFRKNKRAQLSDGESEKVPLTRPAQKQLLRLVNECLLAADCGRRAVNGLVATRCVSLTLRLVSKLLQFRAKPPLLLSILTKCAVLLDGFQLPKHQLTWYAKTRGTATYLLHYVATMCVQLRQVALLPSHLLGDATERYVAEALADRSLKADADRRILDHALELAQLGGVVWQQAEGKVAALLKDDENAEEMLRLLKELSDKNYAAVIQGSVQLVLAEQEKLQQEEQEEIERWQQLELDKLKPPPAPEEGDEEEAPVAQDTIKIIPDEPFVWTTRQRRRPHALTALSLLRCAVARAWEAPPPPAEAAAPAKGGKADPKAKAAPAPPAPSSGDGGPVVDVLAKHRLGKEVGKFMKTRRKDLLAYGFILRALPVERLKIEKEKTEEEEDEEAAGDDPAEQDEAAAGDDEEEEPKPPPPPEEEPMVVLERQGDATTLAHLELMQVAPLMKKLQALKMHWHNIANFKFFDLQQVQDIVRATAESMNDMEGTVESLDGADSDEEEDEENEEDKPEWKVQTQSDEKNRKQAFKLLKKMVKPLTKAAIYASSCRADNLLFACLTGSLNALLLAAPKPEECVPEGEHANPMDTRPDVHVGAPKDEEEEEEEEAEAPPADEGAEEQEEDPADNDVWQHLAMIAQLVVEALLRLRDTHALLEAPRKAADLPVKKQMKKKPGELAEDEGDEEELVAIKEVKAAVKAMEGADEEVRDAWFDKVPDLDISSTAQFVAFAALCMYNMQRWNNVIKLCQDFNDATSSVFATTFLPIAICAQKEVCKLASGAMANTERYLGQAKRTFDAEQAQLPRTLLRHLALQGLLSEPEKLFRKQEDQYNNMLKRQKRFCGAMDAFLKTLEDNHSLAARTVPAAMDALRKSRVILAEFLKDRQEFTLGVRRGLIQNAQRVTRERALRLAAMALVSSYRKAVELLRKRQMIPQVVQALHELGNLQWLEGDAAGAQASWSDAVDTVFQYVYAIKNWRKCVETAVLPPQNAERAELMLLTVVVLAKHARLTTPKSTTSHLSAALFASAIIEAVLFSSLPHPSQRTLFSIDKYRMREIFFGLRESRVLLPPNSVFGGVDGTTFMSSLSFFHNTLLAMGYQQAKSIPLCALHNYIATDVCRSPPFVLKGRLMMAHSLIRCRNFDAAWLTMYSVSKRHDMPRALLINELLDSNVEAAQDMAATKPYNVSEEPYTDANKEAVNQLADIVAVDEADPEAVEAFGLQNAQMFAFLQAEFLVTICSYGRVFAKVGDPEEECRKAWLDKAEAKILKLWKDITGNDDDVEAWGNALVTANQQAEKSPETMEEAAVATPARDMTSEEGERCVELRLLRAWIWELRGDLGKAVREILYGMHFFLLLAADGTTTGGDCGMGSNGAASQLRLHTDAKIWMRLRRRMVHLLVSQGRLEAAQKHIEQGMQECGDSQDELSHIELLTAKMRADILSGRLLEVHGERRLGAIPTAERVLAATTLHLPIPTVSAVYTRLMLCLLIEQNPTLLSNGYSSADPPEVSSRPGPPPQVDPYEQMLLEAAGKVDISPIARVIAASAKKPRPAAAAPGQKPAAPKHQEVVLTPEVQAAVAEMVEHCIRDLDALLAVQDFTLHPHDVNALFRFREGADADSEQPAQLPLLPALKPAFREQVVQDGRDRPNVYLELMPLRLHCELHLARLKMDLNELEEAQKLLLEAEPRLSRCVHVLPWLYVQFCVLKLRLRRLLRETELQRFTAALEAPNDEKYRDPLIFADGICPLSTSPLFRTFLKRVRLPMLTEDTEWFPRPLAAGEDAIDRYLKEVMALVQISLREGGHDYTHLGYILRECLEEVLAARSRSRTLPTEEGAVQPVNLTDRAYHIFCCCTALVEARKALNFEKTDDGTPPPPPDPKAKPDAKGAPAGPVPVDAAQLPLAVALDVKHHLGRQAWQGGLAYAAAAVTEAQLKVPFKALTKHAFALKRECDLFFSFYHRERLLCDQLHVALMQASESYSKAKVLPQPSLDAMLEPTEVPSTGDMFITWMQPSTHTTDEPSCAFSGFVAFICPMASEEGEDPLIAAGNSKTLVARCDKVRKSSLRSLSDSLSEDLEHCRPATGVAAGHVAMRLRALARVLAGGVEEELPTMSDEDGFATRRDSASGDGESCRARLKATLRDLSAAEDGIVEAKAVAAKPNRIASELEEAQAVLVSGQKQKKAAEQRLAELRPRIVEDGLQRLLGSLILVTDESAAAGGPGPLSEGEEPVSTDAAVVDEAQILDAAKVCTLLKAVIRLLDRTTSAIKVVHPGFSRLLRDVLTPMELVDGLVIPEPPPVEGDP